MDLTRPLPPTALFPLFRKLYDLTTDELNQHETLLLGSRCTSRIDREYADKTGARLTYGEVLPDGVEKMLDARHLDAERAKTLVDLGCGIGKLVIQAFLNYPSLQYVLGVELSPSRVRVAIDATRRLAQLYGFRIDSESEMGITVSEPGARPGKRRVLEIRQSDLFKTHEAFEADIVVAQVDVFDTNNAEARKRFCDFLAQLKPGSRVMTYHDLQSMYDRAGYISPFDRITRDERCNTTWCAFDFSFGLRRPGPLEVASPYADSLSPSTVRCGEGIEPMSTRGRVGSTSGYRG